MPEDAGTELIERLRRVRNREIFKAYVTGESVDQIAARFQMSASTAKHVVEKLLLKLWDMIRQQAIVHPYNQVVYPQAYKNDLFKPRYLVKHDLVKHYRFWIEIIDQYVEKA